VPVTVDARDVQGLVSRGYGGLGSARILLLSLGPPDAGRAWLRDLAARVTPADRSKPPSAVNVAFTSSGLRALGARTAALDGFSTEFREGITQEHRTRILGDVGPSAPETWDWGGPGGPAVDAALLVYAPDAGALSALAGQELAAATSHGLTAVRRLDATPLGDPNREHFGFADGISQPTIAGLHPAGLPANTVKAGEFVLGYPNEYGYRTPRPVLPASADPDRVLFRDPDTGGPDLGMNGTYLVLRQIAQDVRGFWTYLDRITRGPGGAPDTDARVALAARWVGRWPGGAPLVVSPERDDPAMAARNDFGYHQADPDGLRCPLGAHIRRAHPRDSLDPEPGTERSIAVDRRHRIVRRGRSYGPQATPEELFAAPAGADEQERGLHFISVNANISRQFEFLQQTWLNNPKFAGLYDDADVIVGRAADGGASFTVQGRPVRRRLVDVPRFTAVRGGAYLFMPGLAALRYLARDGGAGA
jgi:Dyp-type peroxidase family